jgi:hypothetical protein
MFKAEDVYTATLKRENGNKEIELKYPRPYYAIRLKQIFKVQDVYTAPIHREIATAVDGSKYP